jgi:hypothetical protein
MASALGEEAEVLSSYPHRGERRGERGKGGERRRGEEERGFLFSPCSY